MSRFIRDFLKALLGLTPAIFLVTTLQVRVAPAGVIKSGALRGGQCRIESQSGLCTRVVVEVPH